MVHRAAFLRSFAPWDAVCADKWESFFPSGGKNRDIDFPGRVECVFHSSMKNGCRYAAIHVDPLCTRHSTFGIPIAKQEVTKPEFSASSTGDMFQVIRAPEIFKSSRAIRNARFVMRSVLIGELTVAIYCPVSVKVVTDWWQTPDLSRCFLMPIFAIYLLWTRKRPLSQRMPLPIPVLFRI
jgi:hypothetical protein